VIFESGFFTCFNSAGMGDEQSINEILKRIDAIDETRRMLLDESMMNKFLKNKGVVVKSRRSKKQVK